MARYGYKRSERVGDQIKREVSDILQFKIKDPKLGMVTINEVDVVEDLSFARIYYTVLGDIDVREETQRVLDKCAGLVRSEIGRRMRLRIIPELKFVYDISLDRGLRVQELLKKIEDEKEGGNEGEA